jgi:hypothetical protein
VAYRDSFRLLLQFLKKKTGKQPFMLSVDDHLLESLCFRKSAPALFFRSLLFKAN